MQEKQSFSLYPKNLLSKENSIKPAFLDDDRFLGFLIYQFPSFFTVSILNGKIYTTKIKIFEHKSLKGKDLYISSYYSNIVIIVNYSRMWINEKFIYEYMNNDLYQIKTKTFLGVKTK